MKMFTCIEILPENEGILTKIYEKIRPPEPQRQYVQLKGATPFLRLNVRENNIDWCKISALLTKDERVVLKSDAVSLPEHISLTPYVPRRLPLLMMFRALCRVLKKADKPRHINISVFDKDGFLVNEIEKTVPLVRNASVYTEKISEYFYRASLITRESGMSIKINEYESAQKPAEIIIADEYLPCMKEAELVFLADKSVMAYNTVTGEGIFLEEEYKILKSQSIDDLMFASALFERNNAHFLAERDFLSLSLSEKAITHHQLSELVCRSAGE